MVHLENDDLVVHITEQGAELVSIYSKRTELSYLWSGDPSYWPRHAPVLFPIVGRLRHGRYHFNDSIYHLPQHGFARDHTFVCLGYDMTKVTYRLVATSDTQRVYPFLFQLDIAYTLVSNQLHVNYDVHYVGQDTMYFSLGAHPGFCCPLMNDQFSDYYIVFDADTGHLQYDVLDEGLLSGVVKPLALEGHRLSLTDDLFMNDALIFRKIQSKTLHLKSRMHSHGVSISLGQFPYLGLWKKPHAPFICIEPWCGLADRVDFEGTFKEKEGIQSLQAGASFSVGFSMAFF